MKLSGVSFTGLSNFSGITRKINPAMQQMDRDRFCFSGGPKEELDELLESDEAQERIRQFDEDYGGTELGDKVEDIGRPR